MENFDIFLHNDPSFNKKRPSWVNSPRSSMVERVTSNDEVAGSIPSEGISFSFCWILSFKYLSSFKILMISRCHFLICFAWYRVLVVQHSAILINVNVTNLGYFWLVPGWITERRAESKEKWDTGKRQPASHLNAFQDYPSSTPNLSERRENQAIKGSLEGQPWGP